MNYQNDISFFTLNGMWLLSFKVITIFQFYLFLFISQHYPMKQYQFKTLGAQHLNYASNPAMRSDGFSYQNTFGSTNKYSQPNTPLNQDATKTGTNYQTSTGSSLNSISQMKRKLDQLLQQADRYEARKSLPGARNQSIQNLRQPRMTSPDPTYKVPTLQFDNKTDKSKNYQKYQKIIQESKSTRQRFSANQPSTNNEWEGSNYSKGSRLSNDSRFSNNSSFQQSYNFKPSTGKEDYSIDYSFKNNRQPSYAQAPFKQISRARQSDQGLLSLKSKNEDKGKQFEYSKFPLIQNPEKNISTKYDSSSYSPPKISQPKANIDTNYGISNYSNLYSVNNLQQSSPGRLKTEQSKISINQSHLQHSPGKKQLMADTQKLQLKIYDLQSKIKTLQRQNQKCKQSVQSATESKQYYRNQLSEQRKNTNKVRQQYEAKIKQIRNDYLKQLSNTRGQISQVQKKCQKKIQAIQDIHKKKIQQLKQQIQSRQSKIVNLIKQIGNQNSQSLKNSQQLNQSLSVDNQNYIFELEKKDNQIQELLSKIDSKDKNIQILNQNCREYKAEIHRLTNFKTEVESEKYANFDSILMTQLQTIKELKQKIEDLNQKNNQLRTNNVQAQRKIDSLYNEIKIVELKSRSQLNNAKTQEQINMTNKQNIITNIKRKMETLQQKLKLAVNQIKAKDQFIKQYLVGRADSSNIKEHIQSVLSKYQTTFSQSRQEQLAAQLQKTKKQLQLFEKYT